MYVCRHVYLFFAMIISSCSLFLLFTVFFFLLSSSLFFVCIHSSSDFFFTVIPDASEFAALLEYCSTKLLVCKPIYIYILLFFRVEGAITFKKDFSVVIP